MHSFEWGKYVGRVSVRGMTALSNKVKYVLNTAYTVVNTVMQNFLK